MDYIGIKMIDDIDILSEINDIEGYKDSYIPHYYNSWSTYEEHGWVLICEKDNEFYLSEGGYSVMGDNSPDVFDPEKISERDAIELIIEWDNNR